MTRHPPAPSATAHPDLAWEPPTPGQRRVCASWADYMLLAKRIVDRFHDQFELRHFDYLHPTRLQAASKGTARKPYPVQVAYSDWGNPCAPVVVCCGGVANTAMRFNFLASELKSDFRVLCMDWVGRGRSGWMQNESDYSLATCVEQLKQLIQHLDCGPVTLLGSSLGGSAAIELAARYPKLVSRLILNDIGPTMPKKRRKRRAQTLARFYVFREPADLLRRIGASQKNDGPISDDVRFSITFHQTKWSEEDGGRIYRHDMRALQAYQRDAQESLQQWDAWQVLDCPVLLIHGLLSDALHASTIQKMKRVHDIAVMHVPDTGHTPVLSDRNQCWFIHQWLRGQFDNTNWTVLHAPMRATDPTGLAARHRLNGVAWV